MTTATKNGGQIQDSSDYKTGNLALSTPLFSETENSDEVANALRLSGALQTSLDLNKMIEIFALETNKLLPFDQITFRAEEHNIECSMGQPARHRCTYRLVVARETLGELVLSRKKKFLPQETRLIESLLCGLVYPIRNALLYKQAIEAAHKDTLTGIGNRAAMNDTLERELDLAKRHATPLTLLTLDIDHFKRVNDTYGHAIGDCVIKAVAEAAILTIRRSDMIFRFGGEEFVIVLSNTSIGGASLLAERLRKQIADTTIICDGKSLGATASIGIASLQENDTPERLFCRADEALYEAKAAGRNCCRLATVDQPATVEN